MKPAARVVVLALVAFGAAGALILRQQRNDAPTAEPAAVAGGAHLVELGSTSCKSCKAMHEELALLRTDCGTSIAVEEIDVWKDEAAAGRYGVNVIPTQVFLDREGREIDRHVGFLARNEIRQRFAQRGLECKQ